MANKKKMGASAGYIFAAILVTIMYILNTLLVESIYRNNTNVSRATQQATRALNVINSQLAEVNTNSVGLAANLYDNPLEIISDTDRIYANIEAAEKQFEAVEGLSDEAYRRYKYAKSVIATFRTRLESLGTSQVESGDQNTMSDTLKQDLYPLQVTASQMLTSAIEIVGKDTARLQRQNAIKAYILMTLMLVIWIISMIAIWLFAKRAKKARAELEEREMRLAEVDAKLKNTRQKASDLAVTNVLTGMKNRYALDSDISDRLETGRFQIAVFDMDNFRSINDTYGYDFGDEYLAAVAEKLKEEFGDVAEIYNITGNEFCFVFNKNISESQAVGIAQNIQRVMSSPFEVLNLNVQLPCSGAVYHYLPGDCLNVNSLLVKLDTAMRNAKMNGGNMINNVMNM
ncbi:GGDEF domain-containing protein [Ruminococcus sp.]|uniref:GGDEF domain-containing protein n=1 Tax=Ruminococcus sp. TaxID=41978 RepID=UPI001B7296F3|nr:GGDEF domain-containing protein [Ruminococcus sp.]MBP5434032.1 diguanylate cyclase [Ruminococcus sp.]